MMDVKGERVESNIIDRIYSPNNRMSAYDFREALALMSDVHDEVFIRVHHTGFRGDGYIDPDSITGFTFLEDKEAAVVDNQMVFRTRSGETVTDKEVIYIHGTNPYALNRGFLTG
jgi:hypothetical protein